MLKECTIVWMNSFHPTDISQSYVEHLAIEHEMNDKAKMLTLVWQVTLPRKVICNWSILVQRKAFKYVIKNRLLLMFGMITADDVLVELFQIFVRTGRKQFVG